jgi:hypothetical protein
VPPRPTSVGRMQPKSQVPIDLLPKDDISKA